MKTPDQIIQDVRRRLSGSWHAVVADELRPSPAPGQGQPWPHSFPLGIPTGAQLEGGFAEYQQAALDWRGWAAARGLALQDTVRSVHRTRQQMPTHLTVTDI